MRKTNIATERSAYSACIAAQIARNALMESQQSNTTATTAAVASIYQTMAGVQSELPVPIPLLTTYSITSDAAVIIPFNMKNAGKTDAKDFHLKAIAVISGSGGVTEFSYPEGRALDAEYALFRAGETLLPIGYPQQGAITVTNSDKTVHRVNDEERRELIARTKKVSIFGRVIYNDIFGVSHWLQFCDVFEALPNGLIPNVGGEKCKAYNQADSNNIMSPIIQKLGGDAALPTPPNIVCKMP